MSDDDIIAIPDEETFGVDSIYCAVLDGNLEAGNFPFLEHDIISYKISKRKIDTQIYTDLADVTQASGLSNYKDYTSKNYQQYQYAISPIDDRGIIGTSSLINGTHNFWGWWLSSQDNTKNFLFDMNLNTDTLKINEDFKIYDNYTKFAVTSRGKRAYVSGKISAIPYNISIDGEEYDITLENLYLIRDFINDGLPKFLRNTAGEIFKVSTKSFDYKYQDNIISQPMTISWEFLQIGLGLGE
jgi:hypothetical protein